jgi:hypothetical protein
MENLRICNSQEMPMEIGRERMMVIRGGAQ